MSELVWVRSSRCIDGSCVEVRAEDDLVYVRDSKDPDGGAIVYTREQWQRVLDAVREDEWVDAVAGCTTWVDAADGSIAWIGGDGSILWFIREEIDAFVQGAKRGEFDLAVTRG
jgi:hypothetical protein